MMNMQVLKLSEKVTLQVTPVLRQTKETQCAIKYLMHQNAVVTGLFLYNCNFWSIADNETAETSTPAAANIPYSQRWNSKTQEHAGGRQMHYS